MINETLYNKTKDILYQAYFNDTLQHVNCAACAVGNIVAGNNGFNVNIYGNCWYGKDRDISIWPRLGRVFTTDYKESKKVGVQYINEDEYEFNTDAKSQIDSTGYTWQQLAKIEYAFETCECGNSKEDKMFNGLVAVLKVLDELHEVTDGDTSKFKAVYGKRNQPTL